MSATDVLKVPKSAKEAFENNPIASVRALEKQLRGASVRDKERLRVLVGGNYRDILSTAQEIVVLDRSTKQTEVHISDLSRACKPPQQVGPKRRISAFSSVSAQLRLTIQCITCASAALRTHSVFLCAKLTVITRLLLKSLGENQQVPASIETLRNSAGVVRRRLLKLVDNQLGSPVSSLEVLVQAICAYCLVTSASSSDAVKHFRNVRLEKLHQRIKTNAGSHTAVRENFQYLVVSVQLLKSLLGHSINDALTALQKQPILRNSSILDLEALDIDRLHNLIPEDILTFTPYVKRVLLNQEEVQQISGDWVNEACQSFRKGLREVLNGTKSIEKVFALRHDLFSAVLPVYFSSPAQQPLLELVREATTIRVLELCELRIKSLLKTGSDMTVFAVNSNPQLSLWESALAQKPQSSNSVNYTQQVRTSHLGTGGELSRSTKKMVSWVQKVVVLRSQFQVLETTRWQDILEEPDDDDEDIARDIVTEISKNDPNRFRDAVETALQSVMEDFTTIFREATLKATSANSDESQVAQIIHLLRALRQSSDILNHSISGVQFKACDLATKLHDSLAGHIADQISATMSKKPVPSDTASMLPNDLPSPPTFALLRDICKIMSDVGGTDVWSAAAVAALKNKLRVTLLEGEKKPAQLLHEFDEKYLTAALNTSVSSGSLDADDIASKATAYWQRTRLLFGALNT